MYGDAIGGGSDTPFIAFNCHQPKTGRSFPGAMQRACGNADAMGRALHPALGEAFQKKNPINRFSGFAVRKWLIFNAKKGGVAGPFPPASRKLPNNGMACALERLGGMEMDAEIGWMIRL